MVEAQCCGLKCFVPNEVAASVDKTGLVSFVEINNKDLWVAQILYASPVPLSYRHKYAALIKRKQNKNALEIILKDR